MRVPSIVVVWFGLACRSPSVPELPSGPILESTPPEPASVCQAPERPPEGIDATLIQVFPSVPLADRTTGIYQHPDLPGWWYALEQEGRVVRFADDPAASQTELVLDLTGTVYSQHTLPGLLGMAFHPDFGTNGQVFLDYTVKVPGGYALVVSRFTSTDGGATLDPATQQVMLYLENTNEGHNGGNLAFGPDGYLYAALGDGSAIGDPLHRAQDLGSLAGKMLRIDVDREDPGLPYAIPPDNPFAAGGGRPEIWAWGFRNPWRWTIDPVTGELWLGDVGYESWEELNLVVKGGNYGWNLKEGPVCFAPLVDCDTSVEIVDAEVFLQHVTVDAVIVGVVYRGAALPELQGKLLFDDYISDNVFTLETDPLTGRRFARLALSGADDLVSWTTGLDGEAYAISVNGRIYELVPTESTERPAMPATLSATGCMDPSDPALPGPDLVPFEPAQPFWSDALQKSRWLSVPSGAKVEVDGEGDLDFPAGTLLFKEFRDGDRKLETRLLVAWGLGEWGTFTYLWRADGSDADLVQSGIDLDLGDRIWPVPAQVECSECHSGAAGRSLGLELAQLDVDLTYPDGTTENQLDHLAALGLFADPVAHPGALPAVDGPEPVEDRARVWLHVNCAPCHQPRGGTPVHLDLRITTPLEETGLCDEPSAGTLEIFDPLIVAPGEPERSVLVQRVGRRGLDQMPPIGTNQVDTQAVDLLTRWVTELPTCPQGPS